MKRRLLNQRWIALLIAVWVLTAAASAALAQGQLSVGEVKAAPGTTVLVPIALSEGRGVSSLQFTISFDGDVLSHAGSAQNGDLALDHSVVATHQGNQVTVVLFSSSLSPLRSGSGTVAGVLFQVAAGAGRGTATTLRLGDIQASDASGSNVTVTGRNGNLLITDEQDTPAAEANEIVFPQIVNGAFSGGSFVTTLVFVNRTGAVASGVARFFKSDGSPFSVVLTDARTGSSFPFSVRAGGSVFLKTDGTGPLSAGYARVSATSPIGGTALFSQLDGNGQTQAEAGVGASAASTRFSIPVIYQRGSADTGIAFANISTQPVDLTLVLRNAAGAQVDTAAPPVRLAPGQHLPRFATELFRSLSNVAEFVGSIEAASTAPVAAVVLKQQGSLITTLPALLPRYVRPAGDIGNPVPVISNLSPASAAAGTGAFSLTVTGTGFISGASVNWNGASRTTTFVSATQLAAQIPGTDIAAAGTASVTVANPSPGGGISNASTFTITAAPATPAIEITPASLDFGAVGLGQVKDLTLTVRNSGGAALTVLSAGFSQTAFSVTAPPLPFTLAAGAQQLVTVRFTPAAAGVQSGTVTLISNASNRPSAVVALTGTGESTGVAPSVTSAVVTRGVFGSIEIAVGLTDPDGDIVRIEFEWYAGSALQSTVVRTSPTDTNLSGVTTTTVNFTFAFGVNASNLTRVDVQAVDSRGNRSAKVSRTF